MTQDMKKDTILHAITKHLVRNWRTPLRQVAHSSALVSAGKTIETRIINQGVYIVQTADARFTKKLSVR